MTRAILYRLDGSVKVEDVPLNGTSEWLHDFLGGFIESVSLWRKEPRAINLFLFCNEDGIRLGLPENSTVGPFGRILGNYLVVRVNPKDGECVDVTDADIQLIVGATT